MRIIQSIRARDRSLFAVIALCCVLGSVGLAGAGGVTRTASATVPPPEPPQGTPGPEPMPLRGALASPGPDGTGRNGLAVGIASPSGRDRAAARMLSLTGPTTQWRISEVPTDDHYLRTVYLVNTRSGRCLDESADALPHDGTVVYQYACSGAVNQRWSISFIDRGGATYMALVNHRDGRCLDIAGRDPRAGASLQVWHCSYAWNQIWSFMES
jgi:hypothetical protein